MAEKMTEVILKILRQTKEDNKAESIEEIEKETLFQLGLVDARNRPITVNREKRIDLAMQAVEYGVDVAEVVELLTWKDFEGFVAGILVANGFQCTESYRRRGTNLTQGMEIDVIGVRGRLALSIDAKMWNIRSGKATALRTAAEKQKQRTIELAIQLNQLSKKIKSMKPGKYEFIPIIVTWLVEEVEIHEGIPLVPVFKLNSFLLSFDQYQDMMVSYTGQL